MPENQPSPTTRFGYTEAEIKAHREAWLKDLESGEYPQGKGALVVTGQDGSKSYCCMGVACETARKSGLALRIEEKASTMLRHGDGSSVTIVTYDGTDAVLPSSMRDWLGYTSSNPVLEDHTLAGWNDGTSDTDSITLQEIAAKLRLEWLMPKEETPEAPEE